MNLVALSVRWRLVYLADLSGQCHQLGQLVPVSPVVQLVLVVQYRQWGLGFLVDPWGPVCPVDLLGLSVQCRLSDQSVRCHQLVLRDLLAR